MAEGTKFALKLQPVTAQRIGETVNATWEEFDMGGGWWTIPAQRTKNKLAHRVPLSPLTLELLEKIHFLSSSTPLLFPSPRAGNAITETAMAHAIRRNFEAWGIGDLTPALSRW